MNAGAPSTRRRDPEDRPVRRTWFILSGTFLLLGLITGVRAVTSGDGLDWIPVLAVAIAALAAAAHRNAVVALEARGRGEIENFARILQGLSRSVSADAIVGAIVDDLAEGTGADHVVVVRRRPDGTALEATLVTRRTGVPNSSTVLPLGDLDLASEPGAHEPVAIPIHTAAAMAVGVAPAGRDPGDAPGGASGSSAAAGPIASDGLHAAHGVPVAAAPRVRADRARRLPDAPSRRSPDAGRSGIGGAGAWLSELLSDLGIGRPARSHPGLLVPRAEVVGSGTPSRVAARIADRVRAVYGLSHTLAAPLRTEDGVIGAIVVSRRDREPWDDPARRLLEGAAVEASAAFARAYSYREATAHATTDPLTGLPNRRYFDEFCGLLARRRRSGDAVAVLMVDIDKFKVLNDTYGHPVGDEVLKAVAGAIVSAVREEDVPARVGGEEFAVLLRNPGPDVAVEVGERVREAVSALDLATFGVQRVSVSVGVANARGADEPIPSIVERADQALLRAKRAGRDRVIAA